MRCTGDSLPAGPEQMGDVTGKLRRWGDLEPATRADVIERLYPELKRIAAFRMKRERPDHTLQPTALVNEFFIRLAAKPEFEWQSRAHFLAAASVAMRRLLVDHARNHRCAKNGGDVVRVQIEGDFREAADVDGTDMLAFDELLRHLEKEEPRMAQVVELRCFGGLTHAEIAEVIGTDERTAKRDWQVAKAWLAGKLRKGG